MKQLKGALNPLADGVALTVENEKGEVLFSSVAHMAGRDSAGLPEFVEKELAAHGAELKEVVRWTVGSGPGSFTALRLTAALVAAWCFSGQARLRCVPGAVAIGSGVKFSDGERIGVLYDGRNREILYFGLCAENGELIPSGECAVLDVSAVSDFVLRHAGERFVAAASDAEAVQKIFGDRFETVERQDQTALLRATFVPYDNDPTQLVYIRPAVHA